LRTPIDLHCQACGGFGNSGREEWSFRCGGDRRKSLAPCRVRMGLEERHPWGGAALPVC
jgi:hypothetical protein